jgi:hypothetical protein
VGARTTSSHAKERNEPKRLRSAKIIAEAKDKRCSPPLLRSAPSQTARSLEFRPALARRIVPGTAFWLAVTAPLPSAHEALHAEGNAWHYAAAANAHAIGTKSQ